LGKNKGHGAFANNVKKIFPIADQAAFNQVGNSKKN
jgi:hypothetical protein